MVSSSATVQVLFFVGMLLVSCQAQEVTKKTTKDAPNCYKQVNGAKFNDTVTVHYTGKLASNGKQFDSSIGGEPISFELGKGLVIKGWEQGLIGACPGEKATLTIPAELGYGEKGAGDTIPPNADLIFDVEVVDVKRDYHEEILVDKKCTKKQQSRDQDQVFFNYIGRLSNGTTFGEADEETGGPIKIEIGMTGLKGWDRALAGMCNGEVKRAYIPPNLAYGEKGLEGVVPPNEVIAIDIEMVKIQDRVLSFLFKTSSGTAFSGR